MNTKEPYTILFFGRSGAGKGTQSDAVISYLEKTEKPVKYFETGTKFRELLQKGGYTANKIKEILNSGGLLPGFLPITIWTQFFLDNIETGEEHLVLDGFCRRPEETHGRDGPHPLGIPLRLFHPAHRHRVVGAGAARCRRQRSAMAAAARGRALGGAILQSRCVA